MKILVLVVALLAVLALADNQYTLQLLPTSRSARCLDGSPAGFYYHQGTAPNHNKFIIYMDSGGFCSGFTLQDTLESCYHRSKTGLGTTKNYPAKKNLDSLGLLSTDPKRNPVFHDWNKFFFIYCDGSEYTGSRNEPVSYKDTQLYFRGYNNVIELFRQLDGQFDFYNGESIVLTGVSAGGMGTYFYSDYLTEHTKTSKVLSIPDSGLFLVDFYSKLAGTQVIKMASTPLMTLISTDNTGFPFPQCIENHKSDVLECYTASNLTSYFKTPMFIVESAYDAYSIQNIIYTNCLQNARPPFDLTNCNSTTREVIEQYKEGIFEAIKQIRRERKNVGLWAPACAQHGFTDTDTFTDTNFRVPSGTGVLVSESIQQFLDNPDNAPWYVDDQPWPSNAGCSGRPQKHLTQQ